MRLTRAVRDIFGRFFHIGQPVLRNEGTEIVEVQKQQHKWQDHVWYDEKFIYSDNVADLTSAVMHEEAKISKSRFIEGLKWVAKRFV